MLHLLNIIAYLTHALTLLPHPSKFLEGQTTSQSIQSLSMCYHSFCNIYSSILSIILFIYRIFVAPIFFLNFFQMRQLLSAQIKDPLYDIVLPFDVQQSLLYPLSILPSHNISEPPSIFQFFRSSSPSHSTFQHLQVLIIQLY